MTPRIDMICTDINNNISEVIHLITSKGHSRIPVYEDTMDNIIGFMYAKDLLNVDLSNKANNLRNFMRKSVFIPETKNIKDLFQQMKKTKLHLAIVIDEHGGVSGLVTLEDIIEEIVGEIQDEYDTDGEPINKIGPDHYIVEASVHIEQLSQILNCEFPNEEDYDTIAGFLLSQLGRFPKKGEKIVYDAYDFKVTEIKNAVLFQ